MIPERLELPEPSQAVLRAARALLRRKERRATGKFLVEGPQAVREALKQPDVVEAVFFRWAAVHDHVDDRNLDGRDHDEDHQDRERWPVVGESFRSLRDSRAASDREPDALEDKHLTARQLGHHCTRSLRFCAHHFPGLSTTTAAVA